MGKAQSPTYKFVSLLYGSSMEATGHSWQRLNQALSTALCTAIDAGMRMNPDDFSEIYGGMKGGYWFGSDNEESMGERFYTVAVEAGNLSACQSFEAWKGRKPFVLGGRRLRLGSQFRWKGEQVKVTRMPANGERPMVACSYRENRVAQGEYEDTSKVFRRHSISYEALREADREISKAIADAKKAKKDAERQAEAVGERA